jgi:electron transport complex protein RnfB
MLDAVMQTPLSAVEADLAHRLDAVLPQTQCTKCGFAGCRPYAEAIASGRAEINQCPPGGAAGIEKLARLTARPLLPLNPENGSEMPLRIAVIDEALCIGCTLCIQACPVDAIVGGAKRMHTVLAALCTGCDLCVPPCPMDCIVMLPAQPARLWSDADANAARIRFEARNQRLLCERIETEQRRPGKAIAKSKTLEATGCAAEPQLDEKKTRVAAAIERARQRRQQQSG